MRKAVGSFYWTQLGSAHRVLDLGCNRGDLGKYGPPHVEIHGIDINLTALKQVSGYATRLQWDLDKTESLPFPDEYFDAVVAKDILEHLYRPWIMLAEIHRVLKPGSLLLASVITPRGTHVWNDYTHVRGFTMQATRTMFQDTNFEVLDIWKMGGVPGTSRLNAIWLVPYILRVPLFDWMWTRSYEIKARRV